MNFRLLLVTLLVLVAVTHALKKPNKNKQANPKKGGEKDQPRPQPQQRGQGPQLAGGQWQTECAGDKVDGANLELPKLEKDECVSTTYKCQFLADPHLYGQGKWIAEAQKRGYNWVAYFMEGNQPVRLQMLIEAANDQWGATNGIAMHLPNGQYFSVKGANQIQVNCKAATAADLEKIGVKVNGNTYSVTIGNSHIAYSQGTLQLNAHDCKLRKSHGWCSAEWNNNFQACKFTSHGLNPAYVKNSNNYFNCQSGIQDEITKEQKEDKKKEPEKIECTEATRDANSRACMAALIAFDEAKCPKGNFIGSCVEDLCINKPELKEGLLRVLQRNYLLTYGGIHRCENQIVVKGECESGKRKDLLAACYAKLDQYDGLICDKSNFIRSCMEDTCAKPEAEHAQIRKDMKKAYLEVHGGEEKCLKSEQIKKEIAKTEEQVKVWQKVLNEQQVHLTKVVEETHEKHTTIITNKVSSLQKIFESELKEMKNEVKEMNKNIAKLAEKPEKKHTHININIKNGRKNTNFLNYERLVRKERRIRRQEMKLKMIRRATLLRRLKVLVLHRHSIYRHIPASWLMKVHRKYNVAFKNWKSVCEDFNTKQPQEQKKL